MERDIIKVVITGFYTAANRGDQGILDGMVNALSSHFEDVELKVTAHYPEVTQELTHLKSQRPIINTEKAYLLPLFWLQILYLNIWAFMYSHGISLPLWSNKKSVKAMTDADLVLVSGGGFLNDNYKPAILGRLYEIYFANLLKKPVGVYAHSIGPFDTGRYRFLAKFVLSRTDLITVRENISADLLVKIGIKVPIHIVPDAAFALSYDGSTKEAELEKILPIDRQNEMVSISVRKWDFYKTRDGHGKYLRVLSKVADHLVKRGYTIVFCSTCSGYGNYHKDDRITAKEIKSLMKNKEQVHIIEDDLDPRMLVQVLSKMRFHIGTRMHSNIYALLGGTPVIAVGYEHKSLGMMKRMALSDHVVDINEISEEDILKRIDDVLNNYDDYKKKISEGIKLEREKAMRTPHFFSEVL